jgi:hypothetical protein
MTFVVAAIGGGLGFLGAGTLGVSALTGALGGAAIGGMIGGGMNQANAAENAANLQYQGTQAGIQSQVDMFNTLNAQNAPYRETGYAALNQINQMLPDLTRTPTAADISNMPGYQFAVEQGTGGAMQGMNVGGGGSNVQRAGQKFAIDYTMGQALPQYMQQQTNIYNRLAGIAGLGQTAQAQQSQMGQNTATNLAQLGVAGANAQASGQIGSANAISNAVGSLGNAGMMYSLLNRPPT